ncbi:MAG: hypothetical protein VX777_04715 [Chlamydiota bacterium]|nr:hypothetical protein [Chlamydiota bacterium]
MTAQPLPINDSHSGNIQDVINWTGKEFGELKGYRVTRNDIRLLSHTEGFAFFLPKSIWGRLNYQMPISFSAEENSTCWIADKNFAYVKIDKTSSQIAGVDTLYISEDVDVALNNIDNFIKNLFFESSQVNIETSEVEKKLNEITQHEGIRRKLKIYKVHGKEVFNALTNKMKIWGEKVGVTSTKEVVQSLGEWSEFKMKKITILSKDKKSLLAPWISHLDWLINQIDHEIELKALNFSQQIPIKAYDGTNLSAQIKLCGGYLYFDYNNKLELICEEETIGKTEFKFLKNMKCIFVTHLINCSITTSGDRLYSKVGTGLLNFLKDACSTLGYDSIHLTAQTPFNTLLPKNNQLLSFYEKNGFVINNKDGSNFMGYQMEWHPKAPL